MAPDGFYEPVPRTAPRQAPADQAPETPGLDGPSPQTPISPEQIRERAYDIWERHHGPAGFEIEFWLKAERELKAERASKAARG